jgi:co-chaperonin GroES (HSP10)
MGLKPLGSRLLVKPDRAPGQTDSGLIIPESSRKDPEMSGTVVSVGRGPDAAKRARCATIARCMRIVDEVAEQVPTSALRAAVIEALAAYELEQVSASGVKEGDTVCFPSTAGMKIDVDGERYLALDEQDTVIMVKEDDCVAVWTPEEVSA